MIFFPNYQMINQDFGISISKALRENSFVPGVIFLFSILNKCVQIFATNYITLAKLV